MAAIPVPFNPLSLLGLAPSVLSFLASKNAPDYSRMARGAMDDITSYATPQQWNSIYNNQRMQAQSSPFFRHIINNAIREAMRKAQLARQTVGAGSGIGDITSIGGRANVMPAYGMAEKVSQDNTGNIFGAGIATRRAKLEGLLSMLQGPGSRQNFIGAGLQNFGGFFDYLAKNYAPVK